MRTSSLFLASVLLVAIGHASSARATTDAGTCSFPTYFPAPGRIPSDLTHIRMCASDGLQAGGARITRMGDTTPLGVPAISAGPGGVCADFDVTGLLVEGTTYVLTPGTCGVNPSFPHSPVEYVVTAPPTPPTAISLTLSPLHRWFWADGTTTTSFAATYATEPDAEWSRWHPTALYVVHTDGSEVMPSYESNGEIGIECPGDTRTFPGLAPGAVTMRVRSDGTAVTGEASQTYACDTVIEMHLPDAGVVDDASVSDGGIADAGIGDAAVMDGGAQDASGADAGAIDAGAGGGGGGGGGCAVATGGRGGAWALAAAALLTLAGRRRRRR